MQKNKTETKLQILSDSKMKEMYSWNSVDFISKQKLAFFTLLEHTD